MHQSFAEKNEQAVGVVCVYIFILVCVIAPPVAYQNVQSTCPKRLQYLFFVCLSKISQLHDEVVFIYFSAKTIEVEKHIPSFVKTATAERKFRVKLSIYLPK